MRPRIHNFETPERFPRAARVHHLFVALLIAVLTVAFTVAPATAQQAQSEGEPPAFAEVLDVRLVNLEVVVTRKGDRVANLGPEDFRLLVDGREVPIEYFSEVSEGHAADLAVGSSVPAVAPGEPVGTRYLVFVDDFFSIPADRDRVLRELADQLSLMAPEDRMAIVAFDGQRVEMLTSWTRSLNQIEAALETAKDRPAYGLQRLSERRFYDSVSRFERRGFYGSRFANIGYNGSRYGGVGYYGAIPGEQSYRQVARVVDGAASALRAFAKPPGRKVMMLISGGWPAGGSPSWIPGTYGPPVPASAEGHRLFAPLVDTANRLGYTLYPVDLSNGQRNLYGSAEFATPTEAAYAEAYERDRDWFEEGGLLYLAEATGGRAFLDGAAYSALERVVEDTRSYYWLGFSPDWQENDTRHRVKVEVLQPGLKVRSREDFFDLSRQSEVTMMVESAQLFELPLPGTPLAVSLGEPAKAGYKKVVVPVRLGIPLTEITLLPNAEGHSAQLELRIAATDEDGDRADIPLIPVAFTVASDSEGVAVFETQLRLRKKPHRLLFSLYDPSSGEVLSQRVDVSL